MDFLVSDLLPQRPFELTDPALHEAIGRHLLAAQLHPVQARALERDGWFDVIWPEMWVVLHVYADRFPTVDVFQLERGPYEGPGTYLCSYDVRAARRSGEPAGPSAAGAEIVRTPVDCARLVLALYRRGTLGAFLDACPAVPTAR